MLTLATAVLDEPHVPPVVASASVIDEPAHTVDAPVIVPAVGVRPTVSAVVLIAEPHDVVKI